MCQFDEGKIQYIKYLHRFLLTFAVKLSERGKQMRVYYSMCQLEDLSHQPHRYILLSVLTTFCVHNRNDFLVWDSVVRETEIWENYTQIRKYWCRPEIKVDLKTMQKHLLKHCDRYKFIYRSERLVPIDTQDPSAEDPGCLPAAVCNERLKYFQLRRGIRTAETSEAISVPIAKVYADEAVPKLSKESSNEGVGIDCEISDPPSEPRKRPVRAAAQKKEPPQQAQHANSTDNSRKRAPQKPQTPAKKDKKTKSSLDELIARYNNRDNTSGNATTNARTLSTRAATTKAPQKESISRQSTTSISSRVADAAIAAPQMAPVDIEKIMHKFADKFADGIARSLAQITQSSQPEKRGNNNAEVEEDESMKQLLLEDKRAQLAQGRLRLEQQMADEREERRKSSEATTKERQDAVRHSQIEEAKRNAHQRFRERTSDFMQLLQITRQPAWTTLDVNRLPGDKPNNNVGDASGRLSKSEEALLQRLLMRRMQNEDQEEDDEPDGEDH
jgi:hypothetical protein